MDSEGAAPGSRSLCWGSPLFFGPSSKDNAFAGGPFRVICRSRWDYVNASAGLLAVLGACGLAFRSKFGRTSAASGQDPGLLGFRRAIRASWFDVFRVLLFGLLPKRSRLLGQPFDRQRRISPFRGRNPTFLENDSTVVLNEHMWVPA